jgi:hypothetical protein
MDTTIQQIWRESEVVEHHLHPQLSVTTPNGRLRVGAMTFGAAAANTETVTLGYVGTTIVYTFKSALGADPGAGNVTILVQGTADLTARKLAAAVAGTVDAGNILYGNAGVGTQPHPNMSAAYTGVRVSIGAVAHPAGATVIFLGKTGDAVDVVTLSDTVSHAGAYLLTAVTRIYSQRYVFTGNAAALINRVAGAYQCICPMNSVRNPFEANSPVCRYDVGKMVVEAVNDDALIVECDGYYSADELTFTPLWYGLEMSRDIVTKGCQLYTVSSSRIPAGSGFYIKMRSNGTNVADYIEFKAQYHIYPTNLS